ncbi:MAG TPA: hypothetical protein VNO55_18315 [Polyangia bacterium]|nr:hypothetical protein [Polyangia bacterium]
MAGLFAAVGCQYSDAPENGRQRCAAGSKPCPDGYYCFAGNNTCWKNGSSPGDAGAGDVAKDSGADHGDLPSQADADDTIGMVPDGASPDGSPVDASLTCATGKHICDDSCADDTSAMTCGASCTPCPIPEGGTATCVSGSCGGACSGDNKLCAGKCIAKDAVCGTCATGTHDCHGVCASDDSVNSCGKSCTPCAVPANGHATCQTGQCGIACATDFVQDGSSCINEKSVPCTPNTLPAGASDVSGNVTVHYTTAGGWETPAKCAWKCSAAGTHRCGETCADDSSVNSCGVSCTPCSVPSGGSATCSGGICGGACPTNQKLCMGQCIATNAVCMGNCPGGSHPCSGLCSADDSLNSCGTSCTPCAVPANGHALCQAGQCGLACSTDYVLENSTCINQKTVPCDANNANPANSSDVAGNVVIHYTTAGGWESPAKCAWTCNNDYAKEGASCINQKMVPCDTNNGSPANSSDIAANVTIHYTTAGGWESPAKCAWACDSAYTQEGQSCINQKMVPCDTNNGNPANSTDTAGNVTITWSPAGGWTAPAKCGWTCNTNYVLDSGSCINSKQVPCASGGNPANSTEVQSQVTITYTTASGWSAPAACPWNCNQPYTKSGNSCLPAIYMFPATGMSGAIGSRASANARCVAAAANFSFPHTQVVAFISFSATDEIRDLPSTASVPTNRPFVGWRKTNTLGAVVADNWADLLDGTIKTDFVSAGIYNDQDPTNFNNWFSGSFSDGSLDQNCNGWQLSSGNTGNYGNPYQPDKRWIENRTGLCGGTYDLMCLGYTP